MNLFEAVKEDVTAKAAAEYYGIHAGRNDMAICPFHDDSEPSLKLYEDHFHCFGCGEHGDVIDFVGKLYGLNPKQAAEKLAADFGVQYDSLQAWDTHKRPSVIAKLSAAQEYRKKENRCYQALCGYFKLLGDWKERYAPKTPDEEWHPLFMEALQKMDYIGYLLDELIYGSLEDREEIVTECENQLDALEKRIADYSGKEQPGTIKSREPRCPEELAM